MPNNTPLAAAMRPQKLGEILGQKHLIGEGMLLRRMVETKKYQSTIFWGPPGMGKTSLVRCLANETESTFEQLNATKATVKELRSLITMARTRLPHQRTFVFVDEIHRWNKAQQDVMLPVVEDGTIILFGATTERPKFAVNSTLLSRCLVMEVKPLSKIDLLTLIKRIKDYYWDNSRFVGESDKRFKITNDAALLLVNRCSGDARKLITALETCVEILIDGDSVFEAFREVAVEHIDIAIPNKHLVFDARGNEHFDLAHCYQESIQNSDVDAAIYWLAKWLSSGEDPAYICRRMLITAFEDCSGNPFASTTAMAACYTTEKTGLPECMIPMAQATIEMAMSRRDKTAYAAIKEAMDDVRHGATIHVPPELRAGSDGYTAAINKTYVKGWSRDWDAIERKRESQTKSQTMYAIGIGDDFGGRGMIAGPTPRLEMMLDCIGTPGQFIIQFQGDKDEIIYSWEDDNWVKK